MQAVKKAGQYTHARVDYHVRTWRQADEKDTNRNERTEANIARTLAHAFMQRRAAPRRTCFSHPKDATSVLVVTAARSVSSRNANSRCSSLTSDREVGCGLACAGDEEAEAEEEAAASLPAPAPEPASASALAPVASCSALAMEAAASLLSVAVHTLAAAAVSKERIAARISGVI